MVLDNHSVRERMSYDDDKFTNDLFEYRHTYK